MILIADSGSTKTSWCFTNKGKKRNHFTTGGINPFFRTTEDIVNEWKQSPLSGFTGKVGRIFFYGAGVVNEEKAEIIKRALHVFFPDIEPELESDLMGAARATLGDTGGIACILGTGSNSCLYNGKAVIDHVPPLGFVLGDEGSGAVLGKQLVSDYLKKCMPQDLEKKFREEYPLKFAEILNKVYQEEKPNHFLAGFAPFLKKNITNNYCINLVENAFDLFLSRNVAQYAGFEKHPLCFVGSVAFHFQEQLKNVLQKQNLVPKIILKDPLGKIIEFHT